jgi:polysaccharide export outer membrane protein
MVRIPLFLAVSLTTALAFPVRAEAADSPSPTPQPDYVLQPYDLIRVVVFQEPDLGREVRLSPDTTLTLPLIQTVNLNGKTVREAQTIISDLYDRDYLVNPQINLTVLEYSRVSVNVLGAVNTPGSVVIPPDQGLKLLDAIAHAGGFNRLADRKRIKLSRTGADGKTATFTINADDIIQSTSKDQWPLQKADVIYVPESLL